MITCFPASSDTIICQSMKINDFDQYWCLYNNLCRSMRTQWQCQLRSERRQRIRDRYGRASLHHILVLSIFAVPEPDTRDLVQENTRCRPSSITRPPPMYRHAEAASDFLLSAKIFNKPKDRPQSSFPLPIKLTATSKTPERLDFLFIRSILLL